MNLDTLMMYCIFAFFYIVSPGPAVFISIYNGAINGTKPVVISAFGNVLGLILLSTCSMFGLSTLIRTSALYFNIFKVAGIIYLFYLGVKQLHLSFKPDNNEFDRKKPTNNSYTTYFREGFFLAVTNPKPVIFFTALFPQFLNIDDSIGYQFISMTLIFITISFFVLVSYGAIANYASSKIEKSPTKTICWFNRISGATFLVLGAKLFYLNK
ncbi:TPA: LysE family translocator [Vibrio harveyi]|uniref:LysE family translocator n=1 Tax=Vibrio harveyi TaxID=669 RepID=UPI00330BC3A6|nr:LysE family translocator [Vibrio harveyi]